MKLIFRIEIEVEEQPSKKQLDLIQDEILAAMPGLVQSDDEDTLIESCTIEPIPITE